MRISIAALAVLLLASTPDLSAQQAAHPGDRVRVSNCYRQARRGRVRERCDRHVGVLASLAAGVVALRVEGAAEEFLLPWDSVTRLDVSGGLQPQPRKGAVIGLLLGAGAGAVIALLPGTGCDAACGLPSGGCARLCDDREQIALFAAVGGGAGALIGWLIGRSSRAERWDRVPLDRVAMTLRRASGDRLGVGVSVRY